MPESKTYKNLRVTGQLTGGVGTGPEYWFDPSSGSDGNSGESWRSPWKSLEHAYSKLEGGKNETLYYVASTNPDSDTNSGNTLAAAFTWGKDFTHLVGVSDLSGTGNRCRIFGASTLTAASLFTVSATGCTIKNISVFYGVASAAALYAVKVTGNRNLFDNVRIAGIGNDTQDASNAASLYVTGSENEFRKNYIGLTTIGRGTAVNSEIYFTGTPSRNIFNDCKVICRADVNTHTFVTKGDTGNQDWTEFNNTAFYNASTNNAVTLLSAFTVPAASNTSFFFLKDCSMYGCADWEVNNRGWVVIFNSPAATAATDGRGFAVV